MKWGGSLILFTLLLASCAKTTSSTKSGESPKDSIAFWANQAKNQPELALKRRQKLIEKAVRENALLPKNLQRAKNLSRISLAYLELNDSMKFRSTNKELIQWAKKSGNKIIHGEAHWDLGVFLRRQKPDSAFYHFNEAYGLFITAELDSTNIKYPGQVLLAIAGLRENHKDYVGAESVNIQALKYFNQQNNPRMLYLAYNQLGIIQSGLMKFDKALEYRERAKELIPSVPEQFKEYYHIQNANSVAGVYLRSQDFQKAYERFKDFKDDRGLKGVRPELYAIVLGSTAYSGFKSNQLKRTELVELLTESNSILDSIGNQYYKARNKQFLAEIYAQDGDSINAVVFANEGKALAQATLNNDRLLQILELLIEIDSENSTVHASEYINLNAQLQLEERNIQDKFARIQLETDEIIEENQVLAKERQLYLSVAIGILVLGLAIFSIIMLRIKNQRLKFKQKQQEANEEIYNLMLAQQGKLEEGKKAEQKRVSEELHDGILGQMLGIRLIMSGLNDRHDDEAVNQRADLIKKLQEVEEEVRTISHELNASAYEKLDNFIIAIKELVQTVGASAKIKTSFEHDQSFHWDALTGDLKINSYRVVQECLQNCVKHANGNHIFVKFEGDAKQIQLTIEDDGDGFDINKGKKGIGLKNIISRDKKMKGTLDINSELGKGTIMTIHLPTDFVLPGNPKSDTVRTSVVEA